MDVAFMKFEYELKLDFNYVSFSKIGGELV